MAPSKPKTPRNGDPSRRRTTILDVAAAAGVSPMTVSRVINGELNVRDATREAVQAAVRALNYAPNPAAQSLGGKEFVRIGLLYANPSAGYLSELLIGALYQSRQRNGQLVVEKCELEDGPAAANHFAASGIDGVLLTPPFSDTPEVLRAMDDADVRVVNVAGGWGVEDVSSVRIDDFAASQAMTRRLLELGHRRIGFICGHPDILVSELRLQGHLAALAEADLDLPNELRQPGLFNYRSGLEAAESLLALTEPPSAIFAANDDMAAAVVSVAHRRQLAVPRDLTVCGFDDSPIATTVWPELTTIRQPIAEMARRAVDVLTAEVRTARTGARPRPTHEMLDFTLVRRGTDAPP